MRSVSSFFDGLSNSFVHHFNCSGLPIKDFLDWSWCWISFREHWDHDVGTKRFISLKERKCIKEIKKKGCQVIPEFCHRFSVQFQMEWYGDNWHHRFVTKSRQSQGNIGFQWIWSFLHYEWFECRLVQLMNQHVVLLSNSSEMRMYYIRKWSFLQLLPS